MIHLPLQMLGLMDIGIKSLSSVMGEKNNTLMSLLVNMTGIKKDHEAAFQTLPMDWVQSDRQPDCTPRL